MSQTFSQIAKPTVRNALTTYRRDCLCAVTSSFADKALNTRTSFAGSHNLCSSVLQAGVRIDKSNQAIPGECDSNTSVRERVLDRTISKILILTCSKGNIFCFLCCRTVKD